MIKKELEKQVASKIFSSCNLLIHKIISAVFKSKLGSTCMFILFFCTVKCEIGEINMHNVFGSEQVITCI